MNSKIKNPLTDKLFETILMLEDVDQCYAFFEDICTINEIQALTQRWEVAQMLYEHKTYIEIANKTGASTATISRVNKALNYGSDGYNIMLKKFQQKNNKQ